MRLCPGPRNAFLVIAKPHRDAPLNAFLEKSTQKTFEFKLIVKQGWFFCLSGGVTDLFVWKRQKTFESGVLGGTNFQASHSGRGGTVYCDGEGILWICVSKPIILTVGTSVPTKLTGGRNPSPAKISAGTVPGRNYKLLPALAIDSPPGCQCGYAAASRPRPTN